MNDHLNEKHLPEDGLSAEELAILKEALATAWPPPKNSVRNGVMAKIRQERTAEKRRKLRSRIVKYGSLAACLILVTTIGTRILPVLTQNSADMAAQAYITAEEDSILTDAADAAAPCETAPVTEEAGSTPKKSMLFSTAAPETEAVSETAAPADTVPETAAAETSAETAAPKLMFAAAPPQSPTAEAAEEAESPECEAEAVYDSVPADNSTCPHSEVFADSYHTIPPQLISFTGEDLWQEWLGSTEGCEQNIAEYLNYMEANSNTLLSDIEMLYDSTDLWYRYDWDFDLFASGDSTAIDEYYRNGGNFADMVKRESEYRFKLALLNETGAEKSADVCTWSIADLAEEEQMTLTDLNAVYEACAEDVEADYPGCEARKYDLAALYDYAYSTENDEPDPPCSIAGGRYEDAMFHIDSEQ